MAVHLPFQVPFRAGGKNNRRVFRLFYLRQSRLAGGQNPQLDRSGRDVRFKSSGK